jgi:hypothetical protein
VSGDARIGTVRTCRNSSSVVGDATILHHGWLPLRQHHRRPPLLLSVEVVDSGAASRSESTIRHVLGGGLMLSATAL